MPKFVASFNEIGKDDIHLVGEKAVTLGELVGARIPVPDGFVITSLAYQEFIKENKLDIKIRHLLSSTNFENEKSVSEVSKHIVKHIREGQLSERIIEEIIFAYNKLGGKIEFPLVNITLSSTNSSQEKKTEIKGDAAFLEKIKQCWGSYFSLQEISGRKQSLQNPNLSLIVQKAAKIKKSGIIYTINPSNNDKNVIIIEAGLEHYEVAKTDLVVTKAQNKKLSNENITKLALCAEKIEKLFYFPQEAKWVIDSNKIYIVEVKPITVFADSNLPTSQASLVPNVVHDYYELRMERKNLADEYTKTATKLYLSIDNLNTVNATIRDKVDGAGILNSKLLISGNFVHPKKIINDKQHQAFISQLAEDLAKICKIFKDEPVIYKLSDFQTNEYLEMVGGKQFEPQEANPLFGFRGSYRHIREIETLKLELEAIKVVRNEFGYKNLNLLIPFVRTVEELAEIKRIIRQHFGYSDFKLWMSIELPSNLIMLENFISVGIDGVLIDADLLTMLIMGVDRNNFELANEFFETYPAVLWAFEHVIKTAHKHNLDSAICGQAISTTPELVRNLVSWGVSEIFVPLADIDKTRKVLAQTEKELLNR